MAKVEVVPTDPLERTPILKQTLHFLQTIFLYLVNRVRNSTLIQRLKREKTFQTIWISQFGLIPKGTWQIYRVEDAEDYLSYIIPASARLKGRADLFKALAVLNGIEVLKIEHLWRKLSEDRTDYPFVWVDIADEDNQDNLVNLLGPEPSNPLHVPTILYRAIVGPRLDPDDPYALPCIRERISLGEWADIKEYLEYLVKFSLPIECIFSFILLVLSIKDEIHSCDFYMTSISSHNWYFSIRGISPEGFTLIPFSLG